MKSEAWLHCRGRDTVDSPLRIGSIACGRQLLACVCDLCRLDKQKKDYEDLLAKSKQQEEASRRQQKEAQEAQVSFLHGGKGEGGRRK